MTVLRRLLRTLVVSVRISLDSGWTCVFRMPSVEPSQERGMRYAFEDGRGAMKDDEIGACCRIVWSTFNEADGKTHMRQSVSS
ncbi:hypothetical protein HYQ46_009108 [Verticillium longisporum]|nr:hypothetical protein HYQ46_009108 [Verticillium longisporum]